MFLKCILIEKINIIFKHDFGHISQIDWISRFVCIESKVLISKNISYWMDKYWFKMFQELFFQQILIVLLLYTL